eukprot:41170-Pyramimonas_sp.AAC.1
MSGRLCNAGAWAALAAAEAKLADSETMKVFRAAARVRFVETDSRVSDAQVRATLGRPEPSELRRTARLRLLGSLLHSGQRLAFALMGAEWEAREHCGTRARSWIGLVLDDRNLLRATAVVCAELPPPSEDFGPWENLVRRSLPGWTYLIRTALKASAQAHRGAMTAEDVESRFFQTVRPIGVPERVYTDINPPPRSKCCCRQ